MSTLGPGTHDTSFGAPPRLLTENVLQSSGEAVLTNPASVETLQGGEPVPEITTPTVRHASGGDRLARLVAEKPVQSALVSLAAGALLATFVKVVLSRRQH